MATKARFSALPVLQFCGQSQRIRESMGSGRDAVVGSAMHAKFSGDPDLENILVRLTDAERDDLDSRIAPTPLRFSLPSSAGGAHGANQSVELAYDESAKELATALGLEGQALAHGHPDAIVDGTMDMRWLLDLTPDAGARIVVVADIKTSFWGVVDGTSTLQVKGYAIASAHELAADYYMTAIWDATDGRWHVGDLVDVWSQQAADDWARVKAAALNYGGEYSTGTHCFDCHARRRCPQWLLPLELAQTSLAPFVQPGGLTQENAHEALLAVKRAEDTASEVKELLKGYSKDEQGICDGNGKKWGAVWSKGRASLDAKALEKENPELVQRYMKTGAPYPTFRWIKEK